MQSPLFAPGAVFQNQTLRQIVRTTVGGRALRVRFSNELGPAPFTVDAASVAVRQAGASVASRTLRRLTFGGALSITIAPRAVAVSDPVALQVEPNSDLAVSLFVANEVRATTELTLAHQTSFLSPPGNFTSSASFAPISTFTSWYWMSGVDVLAHPGTTTVVAFGDSITEGVGSTTDANARWPDVLGRRLLDRKARLSVVNMAIGGNRVLTDEIGPNAQSRFDRDALTIGGARQLILLEGINDIGFSQLAPTFFPPGVALTKVTAASIIAGYQQLIRRAHARDIRVYGATLLPFAGAAYWDAPAEAKRQTVNDWIRSSDAFDAVIDFDIIMGDPADPTRLNPAYDSGDHLHPNDAGDQAMGSAVPLSLLTSGQGDLDGCD
jgi:lysophospholipase L1-like esterase